MQIIHETLSRLKVGTPLRSANLVMFPLIGDTAEKPAYATLDQALSEGWAEVCEASRSGSVPELKFINRGNRAVLIMDGEELIGAKQNRVLNLTILAPAGKTISLPVSCVEQGRWAYSSRTFGGSPHVMYAMGRAKKMDQVSGSLRSVGTPTSHQGDIWEGLAHKSRGLGVHSPSDAMSDIFEQYSGQIEDYVRNLSWSEGQAGAAFALSGRLIGLDLFGYPDTMKKLLPKIVRSYALDAIEERGREKQELHTSAVEDFLTEVAQSRVETFRAVGLGQDLRLSSARLAGAGLAFEEHLIHLSAFRTEGNRAESDGSEPSRRGLGQMVRSSLRRRRY